MKIPVFASTVDKLLSIFEIGFSARRVSSRSTLQRVAPAGEGSEVLYCTLRFLIQRRLYCHRHTLRYRIRKIEELTGRDLASARDRIEFWLALRGRELVTH